MNRLIKAKEIYVEYAGREILDIDKLEFYSYDRIGLVGANGAGKSTLLKVLLGEVILSGGKIVRDGHVSYLPQLEDEKMDEFMDYALMGKLKITQNDVNTKSGGEETRMKIAQALSSDAHAIFADEPTSHLDREGIDFLINQFNYYSGGLLIISHDRYFLDQVVDKIWELKDGEITEYWGGYSDYLAQKDEERHIQSAQYKQYTSERNRLEKAIEEKKTKAQRMDQKAKGSSKKNKSEGGGRLAHQKTVGSKQKKLHNAAKNMEHRIEALGDVTPPEDLRSVQFRQSKALELHNPYPIMGREISKKLGDKDIFEGASFQFPLGAKIAITGANGAGKTTLFRLILEGDEGITLSPKVKIGYFAQNAYKYRQDQSVMEFMLESSDYHASEILSALVSMGFSHQDGKKKLANLSGGEMIKLQLTKILLGQYNILLLDEPSNFLDLMVIEALENMMKEYKGTIIFITHDARLVDHVADVVFEIKDKQILRKR
ncbi:Msr family ABC-F type ribosomal protection protein [Bacillus horti]|uniref:Macrolide transport system ATP-binding/permease protein n=1 Tax=Caldalkalibacillus horti TaxID=77523 RepID=A0ABT9VW69_9BACI|nr:Msr family ABC-F type ribosomal protection protein [Bacillus horti]MDQ0165246.1 macrolide transport system ATP-binding/permease protein [Bacillus horti]